MRTAKISKADYEKLRNISNIICLDDVYTFMTIQTYSPIILKQQLPQKYLILKQQLAKKTAPAKLEKRTLVP